MKIYIAGKISGLVYEEALRAFAAAEDELERCGHTPVNPMRLIAECGMQNAEWKPCMQHLIPILMTCDAIYLLENWKESKGARLEKHIAQELGMLIVTSGWQGKRGEVFPVCHDCGNVLDEKAGVFHCSKCRKALERLATESTETTEPQWIACQTDGCSDLFIQTDPEAEVDLCPKCEAALWRAQSAASMNSVSSVAKTI